MIHVKIINAIEKCDVILIRKQFQRLHSYISFSLNFISALFSLNRTQTIAFIRYCKEGTKNCKYS